ncbi:uncharacterized protein LOC134238183 [Saccostrea cucullata]|uniref:uncharacterized protein LOC134238183 n=1 Tax=Saccostrea cuccullata TaxID=36930 RepID=UPI002ED06D00
MNSHPEFSIEERDYVRDKQSSRCPSLKELTSSHDRSIPYEYHRLKENKHNHSNHKEYPTSKDHSNRNACRLESTSKRYRMSKENHKDLNRSAVNMDENAYRIYNNDQMSRDYNEDRIRPTRRDYEDMPKGYRGNHSSREDNEEMDRFTSQSYEGMQNRYRLDQPSRKDFQYRNRSTRPRYENKRISCLRDQPLRRDHQERKRSNRKRREDMQKSYHSNQAPRKDKQDRDRSATHRNDPRREKDYLERNEGRNMSRTDEWIVTPDKNTSSLQENDDLAAKIYKVLLNEGGKLKKKQFEACLRSKPLTMRFLPKGAFTKFLKSYSNIFDISDGSITEKEEGEITDPEVRASDWPFDNCRYGHDLETDHNRQSLMHHFMQFLEPDQVRILISDMDHRRGNCAFQPNCKRSHNLEDEQPQQVLSKFGIEMNARNKDSLLKMLKLGSLHSPGDQGQGVRKTTRLYSRSGSTDPDETVQEEIKDKKIEGNISDPRSEISKPLRYGNMACE